MRKALLILTLSALPAAAQAQSLFDQAKGAIGDAAKKLPNAATEGTKKAVGKAVTGKLEKEINTRLLSESRKNQCSFKTDSDELEGGCDGKLRNLADNLISAKKKLAGAGISGFKFEVSGHTDSRGSAAHNKELSGKRAAVIVKELIARGVDSSEIISVGRGSEAMLAKPDNTPAKQAQNRRYELRVRI